MVQLKQLCTKSVFVCLGLFNQLQTFKNLPVFELHFWKQNIFLILFLFLNDENVFDVVLPIF